MSASQSNTVAYGGMQNGSHGEKEKDREIKAKNKMVETEEDKLSGSI